MTVYFFELFSNWDLLKTVMKITEQLKIPFLSIIIHKNNFNIITQPIWDTSATIWINVFQSIFSNNFTFMTLRQPIQNVKFAFNPNNQLLVRAISIKILQLSTEQWKYSEVAEDFSHLVCKDAAFIFAVQFS